MTKIIDVPGFLKITTKLRTGAIKDYYLCKGEEISSASSYDLLKTAFNHKFYAEVLGNWHKLPIDTNTCYLAILKDTYFIAILKDHKVSNFFSFISKSLNEFKLLEEKYFWKDTVVLEASPIFNYLLNLGFLLSLPLNQNLRSSYVWLNFLSSNLVNYYVYEGDKKSLTILSKYKASLDIPSFKLQKNSPLNVDGHCTSVETVLKKCYSYFDFPIEPYIHTLQGRFSWESFLSMLIQNSVKIKLLDTFTFYLCTFSTNSISFVLDNDYLVCFVAYETKVESGVEFLEEQCNWGALDTWDDCYEQNNYLIAEKLMQYHVKQGGILSSGSKQSRYSIEVWILFIKENYKILFIYIKSSSGLTRIMDLSQLEVVWGEHEDHKNQVIWISKKEL